MTGQARNHGAGEEHGQIHAELPRQPPLDRCYREPQRAEVLDFLLHLGPYTNDVLFVIGAKGSGKTTLIRQFFARVADSWRVAYVSADKHSLPDDVAHAASEAWGAQHEIAASSGLISDVGKSAGDARGRGHRPILVIDEAHFLPDVTLNWLAQGCESAQRDKNPLGLVICGEPEVLLSAASARLRKLPHHTFELPALDYRQTAALVAQQCDVLGFTAGTLTTADVAAVFQKAKGNFGHSVELITEKLQARLADAVAQAQGLTQPLTDAASSSAAATSVAASASSSRKFLRWVAAGTLGILVAGALWFQRDINRLVSSPPPADSVVPSADALPSATPALTLPAPAARDVDPTLRDGINVTDHALPRAEDLLAPPAPVESPASLPSASDASLDATTAAVSVIAPPVAESAAVAPLVPPVLESAGTAPAPDAASPAPAAVEPVSAPPLAPAPSSASAPTATDKPASPGDIPGVRDEKWLAAQSPGTFTIQLMAINKEQVVRKVLKKLPDTKDIAYYRYRRGNGYLYALVYGLYPSYSAAQAAAQTDIPKALGPVQPWVRKVGIVQDEIRRAGINVAPAAADGSAEAMTTSGTSAAPGTAPTAEPVPPSTLDVAPPAIQ